MTWRTITYPTPLAFDDRNTQHATKERHHLLAQRRRTTYHQSDVIQAKSFLDLVEEKAIIDGVRQVAILQSLGFGGESGIEQFLFQASSRGDAIRDLCHPNNSSC
jgi:hypothetical protein